MSSVSEVDALSVQMFTSPDPAARQQASDQLSQLTREGADSGTFFSILQQSSNQYALIFVSQGIVKWFKANAKWLFEAQQREIVVTHCGECLKRLALSGAPRHVTMSMLSAFAKLTKLSFEVEPYLKDAVQFGIQLFQQNISAAAAPTAGAEDKLFFLSLLLLDTLVNEMGKYDSSRSQSFMNFATHRRCSNNFRDECLLPIFTASLAALEALNPNSPYVAEVVELVRDCLTYDFMAIMVDETEDALSAQFPSSWRDTLFSDHTRRVLWGQHAALPYPHCSTLLVGLTSLCGIRRTFFETGEERVQYLDYILGILVEVAGMMDGRFKMPEYITVYAEACLRLVAPFGYRDLHQSSMFLRWVNAVCAISMDVFAIPFGQEGSFTTATTLLSFWGRLTTSRRMYMSDDSEKDLEGIAPKLCLKFLESRVQPTISSGGASDLGSSQGGGGSNNMPTSSSQLGGNGHSSGAYSIDQDGDYDGAMEAILTQSESLASMALIAHGQTMDMMANHLNQVVGPGILSNPDATAWLFFIAGSLVRHVLPNVDGAVEPCSRFFVYCVDCANHRRHISPQQASSGQQETLLSNLVERGLLHFLTNVHLILTAARLHPELASVVTNVFQSRAQLFQFILNNTGHNIMRSVENDESQEETVQIMRASIDLIGDACSDVSSTIISELRFDLPPVVELPLSQSSRSYKLRTNLYRVMWLLANRGPYSQDTLVRFLNPIQRCIQNPLSSSSTTPLYMAGWLRDLRGVSIALCDHADAFSDFVEWFCDEAGAFHSLLSSPCGESPMVITSFMRFLSELVDCRSGRYALPSGNHSAVGLLLFKHVSAFIQQVVERCITEEHIQRLSGGAVDGAYEVMLKPLMLSMICLRRCIQAGFVPFGAMWFYNDDTFDNTLLGLLRMLIVFPHSLFREYPKVSYAAVDLLRTITEEQAIQPLAKLSTSELEAVISFVLFVCEDMSTQNGTLLHGMSFLGFIAGLIKEVRALTVSPALGSSSLGSGNNVKAAGGTPPLSPMQLPTYYNAPGIGRVSGTPGHSGRSGTGKAGARSMRLVREALARTLQPLSNLWRRLIAAAMNIIVLQDRALGVSCSVVYPIFEAHPPFWYEFVDSFVHTYPVRKQSAVREALSTLSNAAESQERFFSEVFSFRQQLRSL